MHDPFELIHNNQIQVYEAKKKEVCRSCYGLIFKTDITIVNAQNTTISKEKHHIHCFSPLFETPIRDQDIKISVNESINKNRINNWIKMWNWSVRLKDPLVPDFTVPIRKTLTIEDPVHNVLTLLGKHSIINILSFLTVDEILYLVKPVSKGLYEICWSSHLWKNLCTRDYTKRAVKAIKRTKGSVIWIEEYFRFQKTTCYVCKNKNTPNLRSCPIEHKPICSNCRLKPDFKLLSLLDINTQYGALLEHIFRNFIEKYAITCFGEKVFYKKDVENANKSCQNFKDKNKR